MIDDLTLLKLIKNILQYPSKVCKHAICLDIYDMMERNGHILNVDLCKYISDSDDEMANAILDNEIEAIEDRKAIEGKG